MKTILIRSESDDNSTDDVITWLKHYNKNVEINTLLDNYEIVNVKIELSNKNSVDIKFNNIEITEDTYSWYRRGKFNYETSYENKYSGIHKRIIEENITPIFNFLNDTINNNQINKYNDNFKEKLEMLRICLKLKLNIPDVLLTSRLEDLKLFLQKHKKVITKPVKNPSIRFKVDKYLLNLSTSTKLVTIEDLSNNKSEFLPSLFQKYIEKKFEIRTFYLEGHFSSMAIFSQENEKTKIDFRNYDVVRPNRCVPYLLPKSIEKKLHKLMLELDLNCGSFDLIYTPSGKYYFLEVNPIGQFQWLSQNCNYYIDKIIAKKMLFK